MVATALDGASPGLLKVYKDSCCISAEDNKSDVAAKSFLGAPCFHVGALIVTSPPIRIDLGGIEDARPHDA